MAVGLLTDGGQRCYFDFRQPVPVSRLLLADFGLHIDFPVAAGVVGRGENAIACLCHSLVVAALRHETGIADKSVTVFNFPLIGYGYGISGRNVFEEVIIVVADQLIRILCNFEFAFLYLPDDVAGGIAHFS